MEKFEEEKYTLIHFMQCLEDILKYIDNFSCEHTLMLDIPPSTGVPKTGSLLDRSLSDEVKPTKQQFLITRRKKNTQDPNEQSITVGVELKEDNEQQMVVSCSLCHKKCQNITDRAKLRDAICAVLNPNLRVLPILNFLVDTSRTEVCPLQPDLKLSRMCLRICKVTDTSDPTKYVLLAVNKDDVLVSWEEGDPNIKTWDLGPSDHAGLFSKNSLLFLSYVIGTINQ